MAKSAQKTRVTRDAKAKDKKSTLIRLSGSTKTEPDRSVQFGSEFCELSPVFVSKRRKDFGKNQKQARHADSEIITEKYQPALIFTSRRKKVAETLLNRPRFRADDIKREQSSIVYLTFRTHPVANGSSN